MPYYNLVAEYASLIVIFLAMIGFAIAEDRKTNRFRALRLMQFAALISIVITIGSLLSTDYFMYFPVWVVDILKHLYFLTSGIIAPLALFYAITLMHPKTENFGFFRNYIWAWLPYAIYSLFVLTNGMHKLIFTISPTEGYVRGEFFRITYVIALLYILMVVFFAIKNYKSPQRNELLVICFNLLLASLIFCSQLIFPKIQLSGLASVAGVLIVQFYVHNVSYKSDSLTELYNRTFMTTIMNKLCKSNTPFSLFVFSLRNFKGINERNGLQFGDILLEQIGRRLREELPFRQIFRYSGDEFALLIPNYDDVTSQKIKKIHNKIEAIYTIGDNTITPDFVYARVDFPEFGSQTEEIISAMDYSLDSARQDSNRTSCYYEKSICNQMKRRNYIIERIKKALETDGFEAYYQPIYSVIEDDFSMAEALIRFKSEEGEFISPGEFIPIAEDTGLIGKITTRMLELVCTDYRRMIDMFGEDLKVKSISINFPYSYFTKEGAAEETAKIVRKYNLSPKQIKMELTERTLVSDIDSNLKILNQFAEKGFVFELDDFGIEYSNFSMLFKVPIRIVKFDRSLIVNSMADDNRKDFFIKFVSAMKAIDKNLEIVMEGVETKEINDFLIACGGDYIQGFVYSKPLPYNEYIEFIS